jgi:peptidoglycan/LPS O-acetylase OafA/YrhL
VGRAADERVSALDGMRAVAVIVVVVFHAGLSWLPGGFLGVDFSLF